MDKPLHYMAGICKNNIAGDIDTNYHIFLNSVEDIGSIIRTAKLTPENTRVICSQSEETLRKNLSKLPDGFAISKALDELKPISFYTSTCFEGQDIIDPNGRTFIVSNGGKEHTLMDISTSFIQICGRIRKSEYNDEIVHLYSTTRYDCDISLAEFEEATYNAINEAEKDAECLNSVSEHLKQGLIKQLPYINEPYIRVENDCIIVDYNLANFDIINYKIVNGIYRTQANIESELTRRGLNITDNTEYTTPKNIELVAQVKLSFKEMFELYCQLKQNVSDFNLDYRLELIEQRNPLVKEAYKILGCEEVRRMKHHQSNIRRELIRRSSKGNDYKIASLIEESLPYQKAVPVSEAKKELQEIYDRLGLMRKAKATDLMNWFETK